MLQLMKMVVKVSSTNKQTTNSHICLTFPILKLKTLEIIRAIKLKRMLKINTLFYSPLLNQTSQITVRQKLKPKSVHTFCYIAYSKHTQWTFSRIRSNGLN